MKFKTIIALILIALFLVIVIQNVEVVEIKFLFWTIIMSRIIFIPLIMLIGFILGFFASKVRKK